MLALVIFDWTRTMIFGQTGIINWNSPIHAGWVVFSSLILMFAAFLKRKIIHHLGLNMHFFVFALSFMNQIIPFNDTFNYYCMLFNFGIFTAYFFSKNYNTN